MLKFIFILISIAILGFLVVNDTWMVSISAFGFEITTSILVFIVALFLMFYILHLLKKPFRLFGRYQTWAHDRKQSQRENYLLLALKTALDGDTESQKLLIKQKNKFFNIKSDENFILEALFNPTPHTFEQLLHREATELAGIKGLVNYAKQKGDYEEVNRLLQKAYHKYPNELWIYQDLWTADILQNDWTGALSVLDVLKKNNTLSKEEYIKNRAMLLLKTNQVKDAYKLYPNHPAIAVAYAKAYPKKALNTIMDLWKTEPCWDAFLIFQEIIHDEKPKKQIKLVQKLVKTNPEHRISLIALAQIEMDNELWGLAKEHLTEYINAYSLTAPVALMMAKLERNGWHHEEEAKTWEAKSLMARPGKGWGCASCGTRLEEWDVVCPKCNTFGSVWYK